jgi:transposase
LAADIAPQLLAERGCGPLTAAKLIGELAGAERFATDAKLARAAGTAPIPASSGNRTRHRLDRGGNRQLNCALHRLAVNKGIWDPASAAHPPRPRHHHSLQQADRHTRLDIGATAGARAAVRGWSVRGAARRGVGIYCRFPTVDLLPIP